VFEYNLAGIRAYEKAGFRRVGVRRMSKFMGGRMWDTVVMDAVAEDFDSPVLGQILVPDLPRDGPGIGD
jgi:RimJ/RimL family protein N-acetyltransferase